MLSNTIYHLPGFIVLFLGNLAHFLKWQKSAVCLHTKYSHGRCGKPVQDSQALLYIWRCQHLAPGRCVLPAMGPQRSCPTTSTNTSSSKATSAENQEMGRPLFIVLHFIMLCRMAVLQFEILWQPCVEQVSWHYFSKSICLLWSLCHMLVILHIFQTLHEQKTLWYNEGSDDGYHFWAIKAFLIKVCIF